MRDHFTGDNIDVRVDEMRIAYIMVEPALIRALEELLQKNGIPFTLDDGTNQSRGAPEAAVIEFGKDADLEKIQRVLDSAS